VSALFSLKKVHVTKKISSRQATSRTHVKKNPDQAISEFFLIKKFWTRNQNNFKTRPSSFLFKIARGSGATLRRMYFFFKKAHTNQRSQEALHGFARESTRTTLVPAQQDLKEQDEDSRAQP